MGPILVLGRLLFLLLMLVFLWQLVRTARRDLEVAAAGLAAAARRSTEPRVVVMSGPLAGQTYPVRGSLELGRDPACDIRIDDGYSSGRHARLQLDAEGCFVVDLQSTNGTLVDGRPVTVPTRLRPGQEITVGATRLRFEA